VSAATLALVAPLWVGAGGIPRRALSWGPLVWIGVVSYGAYLWHWPVTLWLRVREPGVEELLPRRIGVVLLTFGLAAISFHVLEEPIRNGAFLEAVRRRRGRLVRRPRADLAGRRTVATLVAVPITLVGAAGMSLALTRVPPIRDGVPVVMIVGDSVPARLSAAFERAFTEHGWRFVTAALGGCPPTGETPVRPDGTAWPGVFPGCRAEVAGRQDALIASADPDVIVWWDRFAVSGFVGETGLTVPAGTGAFWTARGEALDATVRRLGDGGAFVVFIEAEPPAESVLDRCREVGCDWPRFQIAHYEDVTVPWNAMLRDHARRHPDATGFVSITDVVCREDVAPCDDRIEGVTARRDGVHYEGAGEEAVIEALLEKLAPFMERFAPIVSA
jgi:hypothetical protein